MKNIENLQAGKFYYEVISYEEGGDGHIWGVFEDKEDAVKEARYAYNHFTDRERKTKKVDVRYAQAIMVDGDDEPWFDEGNYDLIDFLDEE